MHSRWTEKLLNRKDRALLTSDRRHPPRAARPSLRAEAVLGVQPGGDQVHAALRREAELEDGPDNLVPPPGPEVGRCEGAPHDRDAQEHLAGRAPEEVGPRAVAAHEDLLRALQPDVHLAVEAQLAELPPDGARHRLEAVPLDVLVDGQHGEGVRREEELLHCLQVLLLRAAPAGDERLEVDGGVECDARLLPPELPRVALDGPALGLVPDDAQAHLDGRLQEGFAEGLGHRRLAGDLPIVLHLAVEGDLQGRARERVVDAEAAQEDHGCEGHAE
mmetsp:Transcript_33902/g.95280  ORF Transcript_33902/g.95280 Transcript_33902/m.95280 type:complete len:275 (-) Transcript_33902:601-1425(-)